MLYCTFRGKKAKPSGFYVGPIYKNRFLLGPKKKKIEMSTGAMKNRIRFFFFNLNFNFNFNLKITYFGLIFFDVGITHIYGRPHVFHVFL